ncbi:hypothetical protein Q3G72_033630 [Acer saccharum]|nr:hypothetical protein Q3G72_003335 [Acer saccharum]KAK1572954.1 hypothetical protein Q3G72_033630 [Acer saccharum]
MGIAFPSRGRRGIWCCRIDDRERVDNVLVCFSRTRIDSKERNPSEPSWENYSIRNSRTGSPLGLVLQLKPQEKHANSLQENSKRLERNEIALHLEYLQLAQGMTLSTIPPLYETGEISHLTCQSSHFIPSTSIETKTPGSLATRSNPKFTRTMDLDQERGLLCGIRHGLAPARNEMGMEEPKLSIGMDLTYDCWDEPE